MLTNQEFAEFVEDITSGNLSLIVATLEDLRDYPSADERVLPYLERLQYNKTPCILGIPLIFGEVRWLAAHALAAERAKLGIRKPIYLRNVVKPINTAGITYAEEAANIEFKGGVEGVLENLAILRDKGYLPLYDLYLPPPPLDEQQHLREQKVLAPALAFSAA